MIDHRGLDDIFRVFLSLDFSKPSGVLRAAANTDDRK